MKKQTVFITGTSTGIGKETVLYFAKKGWNVAATMRIPEKAKDFIDVEGVKVYKLDVTDEASISNAINQAMKDFGDIDVLVNNAGYGAVGIFEKATNEQIRKQFDTNVFGVMNVTRAILPHFRKKRNGTIINVTSMGGLVTFPIYSVYHGTKWAVEGFAESLAFELRPFNIKVKNVEPGAIKTDFYDQSMDLFQKEGLKEYDDYEKITYKNTQKQGEKAPGPENVAKKIYQAATEDNFRLRYPVGREAPLLLKLRNIIPQGVYNLLVRSIVEKGL